MMLKKCNLVLIVLLMGLVADLALCKDVFYIDKTLTLKYGEYYVRSLVISGNYLYAGLDVYPGMVVKIDLDTFTKVDTLTLDYGEYGVASLAVSDNYLYAGLWS
ncbi:MAG: hypothetical protein QXK24_01225, partial [Ignisphaera sp.]